MKKEKRTKGFIVIAALIPLAYVIYLISNQKNFDWSETYNNSKTNPYDSYVVTELLKGYFPNSQFHIEESLSINDGFKKKDTAYYKNYVFIGNFPYIDSLEADALLEFVDRGNTAMIISNSIPGEICKQLILFNQDSINDENAFNYITAEEATFNFANPKLKTKSEIKYRHVKGDKSTSYQWNCFEGNLFDNYEYSYEIEGYLNTKYINFIHVYYGSGHLFLHLNPILFTNYNLQTEEKIAYAEKTFSYLTPGNIYYDLHNAHFGREHREQNRLNGPLKFILSNKSLKWSWYLLLLTTLLYVWINSKRRQSVIPILEKKRNTSLNFVKALGELYFKEGENKKICLHQMRGLLSFIREKYYLPTNLLDEVFVVKLNAKSGISMDLIKEILSKHKTMSLHSFEISSSDLLEFNQLIKSFYNNCK